MAFFAAPALLGVSVPTHVQTGDFFAGYAGTRVVDPQTAAGWLTWAETDPAGSLRVRPFGIKTMLYTDPNRAIPKQSEFPEYARDEASFAHDCSGLRITTNYPGQYLMDPHSATVRAVWKEHVDRYQSIGHFDAIFVDDADDVAYVRATPCNYDSGEWLRTSNALQRSLGYPIVYNGLSNFSDHHVSESIGLNDTAIGGMMEQCYAPYPAKPKAPFDHWIVNETTELQMAQAHKLFFCLGNDTSAAVDSLDARLYVYASFLLTYDLSSSILWEYYQGPSHFHVMPESQLVALHPQKSVTSVSDLLAPSGLYQRSYEACYLAGRPQGPCIAVVNPTGQSLALSVPGYHRTLQIAGAGAVDGGTVRIAAPGPPSQLPSLSAAILFK